PSRSSSNPNPAPCPKSSDAICRSQATPTRSQRPCPTTALAQTRGSSADWGFATSCANHNRAAESFVEVFQPRQTSNFGATPNAVFSCASSRAAHPPRIETATRFGALRSSTMKKTIIAALAAITATVGLVGTASASPYDNINARQAQISQRIDFGQRTHQL